MAKLTLSSENSKNLGTNHIGLTSTSPITVNINSLQEDQKAAKTAQQTLQKIPPEESVQSNGWGGFWSWLGYGNSTQKTESHTTIVEKGGRQTSEEEEVEQDGELLETTDDHLDASGNQEDDGGLEHGTSQKEQSLSDSPLALTKQVNLKENKESEESSQESNEKKPPFEATTVKTTETGQGWIRSLYTAGAGLIKQAVVTAAGPYLGNFAKGIDKASLINADKKTMIDNLKDPQFVELSDLISQALVSSEKIRSKLDQSVPASLENQKGLIFDLIEINISRGFANLSNLIKENKDLIPNYDKQSSFVNLLSLLCQKGGAHLKKGELAAIELKYRETETIVKAFNMQLFPELEKQPERRALMKRYIHENNAAKRELIFNQLFPDLTLSDDIMRGTLYAYKEQLDLLHQKSNEVKALFSLVADDILVCLFPKKLDDLVIPSILQSSSLPGSSFIPNMIYQNFIKAALVDIIQESYEPLENDFSRNQSWEKTLEKHVGETDLSSVIEAPSALMMGLTKHFIQTNPQMVKLTADLLASAVTPSVKVGDEETIKSDALLAELSQESLANWIVESIQTTLHTNDPNLLALGGFVHQIFNNLTLGLLAKGTALVIPENEKINPDHFIKELSDRIVAKTKSSEAGELMSEQFWKDLLQGLPLPPALETLIGGVLNEKTNEFKTVLNRSNPVLDEKYLDTEKTIRGYKAGKQFLSIIKEVTDQIIHEVLEQNVQLIETFELGDKVDELLDQFLPGIQIDDALKNLFKNNIGVLAASEEGRVPQSVQLLKEGIQAILRRGLVITVETNFKNDSEAYAAQVFNNIHHAFGKAFGYLDVSQRAELTVAMKIQEEIEQKESAVDALKNESAAIPAGLSSQQQTILDDVLIANGRYLRASNEVEALQYKLGECLAKLNEIFGSKIWKPAQLQSITQALVLRKMHASSLRIPEKAKEFRADLKRQIEDLKKEDHAEAKQTLATCEMLDMLLEMNSDELLLISKAVHIQDTLKHAEKEREIQQENLIAKKLAYHEMNEAPTDPSKAWKAATAWLEKALEKRQAIHRLTQEIAQLKVELDSHLEIFKVLSRELAVLVGLDKKEKLFLPPFLLDMVWPLVESAKEGHIARLLFTHLTPLLLPALDVPENREKLKMLAGGDDLFVLLAQQSAEEIISRIPDLITSYKPSAEAILTVMGVDEPAAVKDVKRMEEALQKAMIQRGREGVAASMIKPMLKGYAADEQEDAVGAALEAMTKQKHFKKFTKEQILPLLKDEKDGQLLKKQADRLVKELNQFLLNRGKAKITNQDLLNAYQNQRQPGQPAIDVLHVESILKALEAAGLVQKIKTVIITPEEIAQSLNDFIPGARDLHKLIAPELQAVIAGEDQTLKNNHEFLQLYLEGMFLRGFIKIAEANKEANRNIFSVLAEKIGGMTPSADDLTRLAPEEIARKMIDAALSDIIDVNSPKDFEGILLPLQKIAYNKTKEIAYQHLTPLLLPMIERAANREALNKASGSKFFGSLCEVLSKNIFFLLPSRLTSYRPLAAEIYSLLSGTAPTPEKLEEFAQEIAQLIHGNRNGNFTNTAIVQAYAKIANVKLTKDQVVEFKSKLKDLKTKERIKDIVITPEEIAALLSQAMPCMDAKFQQAIADEIQQVVHGQPKDFEQAMVFGQAYLEGVLIKIFQRIAEKNPPQNGKDSFFTLVEKLLDLTAAKYHLAKGGSFDQAAVELNDAIMKDILGIDSPEVFAGLPTPLKHKIYENIKDKIGGMLIRIHQNLQALEGTNPEIIKARTHLKQFGAAANAAKANAEIFAEDLANLVVDAVPSVLTEMNGGKMRGVNVIAKSVENTLHELARGNMSVANVILNYPNASDLEAKLVQLAGAADSAQHLEAKQKAADLVSNLIVVPLNELLEGVTGYEKKHGAEFNQKMMGSIFHVVADHIKNLSKAKNLARVEGRSEILHRDFVAAVGKKLSPAVPTSAVNYQKTLDAIFEKIDLTQLSAEQKNNLLAAKERVRELIIRLALQEKKGMKNLSLTDLVYGIDRIFNEATGMPLTKSSKKALKEMSLKALIREEMNAHEVQRESQFYSKEAKALLKQIFPKGRDSLTFVDENLRGHVWKLYKKNLFPVILPMLAETFLSQDVIDAAVVGTLQATRDSLNGKIVLETGPSPKIPLTILGEGASEMMTEIVNLTQLPQWMKDQMVDPKTGKLYAELQNSFEATLSKQFNETFLKENLEKILSSATKRDPLTGDYALKFDKRPKADKLAETSSKRKKREKEIARLSRQVVDSGISYFIRKKWVEAQARFDKHIEKTFGKIGRELKHALDAVFRFIFFTIIGTVLSALLWPLKQIIKGCIYRYISLDENRDILLNLFRKAPVDQPASNDHVVYNEDMVYKIVEAVHKVVDETESSQAVPA